MDRERFSLIHKKFLDWVIYIIPKHNNTARFIAVDCKNELSMSLPYVVSLFPTYRRFLTDVSAVYHQLKTVQQNDSILYHHVSFFSKIKLSSAVVFCISVNCDAKSSAVVCLRLTLRHPIKVSPVNVLGINRGDHPYKYSRYRSEDFRVPRRYIRCRQRIIWFKCQYTNSEVFWSDFKAIEINSVAEWHKLLYI